MATMYLLSGPSGAGKTCYAKYFSEIHDVRCIGIDDFYAMMNGDETIHENEFEVWIAFYQAIYLAAKAHQDIIIDVNSPTVSKRREFIDWFGSYFTHRVLIFINADPELCKLNNASRKRVVPDIDLKLMRRELEHPTQAELQSWDEIRCFMNEDNCGYAPYDTPFTVSKESE